ncbi:hypothetical protein [Candidatus Cardinium hertigii]|jgi:hypothetical protein|uniref:Uncharacterized protein n=1 Tax=Candidatus Cardinium hertigii TaxID=247481 RepID=A0A3N2QC03_9BACT|nr:hypothetical protein [Candidatus Cardinium hertigii]ROT47189.1 hypothetical protein EDM02_03440 [Candidatus Cardinium hertigii]
MKYKFTTFGKGKLWIICVLPIVIGSQCKHKSPRVEPDAFDDQTDLEEPLAPVLSTSKNQKNNKSSGSKEEIEKKPLSAEEQAKALQKKLEELKQLEEFQALIPFPDILEQLEKVIIQSKVLSGSDLQIKIKIKRMFMAAGINTSPPITEKEYVKNILRFFLGWFKNIDPITLCDQLADVAKQAAYHRLVEIFADFKKYLIQIKAEEENKQQVVH